MSILESIIIALIEGITEFLPVSSTGHMIMAASLMNINEDQFVKTFEIIIQLGAILAIVLMYSKQFLKSLDIYLKLALAFLPIAVFGFLGYSFIKEVLFGPLVVAISIIVGGIVLIIVDKKVVSSISQYNKVEDISYKHSFFIGLIQCFALIPGVSRAAATIVGGVFNGLDKKQSTEFSFLLAVPTMLAASGYDLLKTPVVFSNDEYIILAIGLLVAFVTAWFAVKIFLKIVENYGFKHFGYYRIVMGIVFLYFYV